MVTEIDLRDDPDDELRKRLGDALDRIETRDERLVIADRDIDPHLVRYQIERDRGLEWEHRDPDADPRAIRVVKRETLDDGEFGTIDVRDLIPRRRHEVLLDTFDRLKPGAGFTLVNDHDPKPLYYELESIHGDVVGWEYASRESDEWRVDVEKTGESTGGDEEVLTRYDVRRIPKSERHDTIHHRYGMIPDGETMEIVAPHEPRPLHREFRERYGDAFDWEVVETGTDRCRVRIAKTGRNGSTSDDEASVTTELDVRDLPPAERHERIFDAYEDLDDGEGFVLVNDHDPKPLYHQFDAEAGPEFHWEYRKRDPGEFRVLIGKTGSHGGDPPVAEDPNAPF